MKQADILIVEDDANLREAISETLQLGAFTVVIAEDGQAAIARLQEYEFKMVLTDVQMQPMDGMELLRHIRQQETQLPVVVMTAYGTIEKAVDAMRLGASDYLVKPFEANDLSQIANRFIHVNDVNDVSDCLLAQDEKMQSLKQLAARVAQSEATVLLCGESGVGKEVFAQYIHQQSSRSNAPFVAINCAAIPENMLESVLFGYEKGSFTGAVSAHAGKFEQAQKGTLLLDEISEMDVALQAKLLRVLQEKEVERLGAKKSISLDVRILATTNRNLREEVSAGRFREDLYYRISVFPILIPPLRERMADIMPIAQTLLKKYQSAAERITFTPAAQQKLVSHDWPGNVRELDNVMQRAVILKQGAQIDAETIHFESMGAAESILIPEETIEADSVLVSDLKDREQQLILEALRAGKGSRKYAAERLGISPRTLRYKLARMRDAGITV